MSVLLEVVVGCFTSWCASINAASGVHQHTPDVGVYTLVLVCDVGGIEWRSHCGLWTSRLVTGGLWMILKLWTDGLRTVLISDAFAWVSTGEIAMVCRVTVMVCTYTVYHKQYNK
jgi:hypothetical protein